MIPAELEAGLSAATVFDLSHPYTIGMPQSPNHPPFRMVLERRHGDMVRADGGSAANEIIVLGGHVGTHIDALAHVSHDGKLHGGVDAASVQTHRGFTALGIEQFRPYVGRAVFLDVAAVHGVPTLPAGYEVTSADLEAARAAASAELRDGEAILIGTGWARNWSRKDVFTAQAGGAPGPGVEAARWLADHGPAIIGAETIAFEHIAPGAGHALLPVHGLLLVERGINIIETMNLTALADAGVSEFWLIVSPLLITGATGAPVRPLAIAW
jgi:kynurenine formamidase